MDLLSLPENVRRKIALLLDQSNTVLTAATSHAARGCPNLARSPGPGQPARSDLYDTLPNTIGHASDVKTKAHTVASRLKSASAAVVDTHFLGSECMQAAAAQARQVLEHGRQARLGGGKPLQGWESSQARGDQMVWLKRPEQVQLGHTALVGVMDALLNLQQGLAQHWDVMGPPSLQLAMYPGNAARYVRHADASDSSPARSITAIYYLNPDWDGKLDGGKLCLYHKPAAGQDTDSLQGEQATLVTPAGDTLVVFDSHTEHEVLPSFADRYAITVWFSRIRKEPSAGAMEHLQHSSSQQSQHHDMPECNHSVLRADVDSKEATSGKGGPGPEQKLHQPSSVIPNDSTAVPTWSSKLQPSQHSEAAPDTLTDTNMCQPTNAGNSRDNQNGAAIPQRHISKPGSIFVSVAAYRDPECQWTMHNLFQQADAPDLVTVGVVWQVDAVEDAAFVRVAGANKRHKQVREIRIPWQEATGPCKARHLAQQLWDGEEFCLQIDSHTRFVAGWDTKLKQMLQQGEKMSTFGKAVVSSYPPPYDGEGAAASLPPSLDPTIMQAQGFDQDGMLRLTGKAVPATRAVGVMPAQFWAAGFSFSRAQLFAEVPYDPDLPFLFFGEEMSMLVRMWTRGWDVVAPTQAVAFHLWSRAYRHTFQADIAINHAAKKASQAKVKQMLAVNIQDGTSSRTGVHVGCCIEPMQVHASHNHRLPADIYSIGQGRTLEDFWQHCGQR